MLFNAVDNKLMEQLVTIYVIECFFEVNKSHVG